MSQRGWGNGGVAEREDEGEVDVEGAVECPPCLSPPSLPRDRASMGAHRFD